MTVNYNWEVFDTCHYGSPMDDGDYPSDYYGSAYFVDLVDAWAYYKAKPSTRFMPRSRAAHPDAFICADLL